jgi:hypothetical protein
MNQTPPWAIKPLVLEEGYTKPIIFKDKVGFATHPTRILNLLYLIYLF